MGISVPSLVQEEERIPEEKSWEENPRNYRAQSFHEQPPIHGEVYDLYDRSAPGVPQPPYEQPGIPHYVRPNTPRPAGPYTPAAPENFVDSQDPFTPLEPLPDEFYEDNYISEDDPWSDPTRQWNDPGGVWSPFDAGVSLTDVDRKVKEAEKEAQYRKLLENSNRNKEKPWLDPLPHPYGPFVYRLESPTRGLGGEVPEIQQTHFEPYARPIPKETIEFYDWEKEEEDRFDWSKFDPAKIATQIRDWMGLGPDEQRAAQYLREAYKLLGENNNFRNVEKTLQAAKYFEKAAARWPDSVLEEDALFHAAECYFFADRYPKAGRNYEKLITKHRSTKHMDVAVQRLFRIGRYWESLYDKGVSFVNTRDKTRPGTDTFGNMKKTYEAIFTNDPTGPFGDRALMALAGAYLRAGKNQGDSQFTEAATLYAALADINPRSEYLIQARKLELLARSKSYVGAEYDAKALEDASHLSDQIIRQHGEDLGEERRDIMDLRENISMQKAQRLWEAGQYYERKKMYSSARYSYEKLMQNHPSSPLSEQARQRHAKIIDLEDQDDNLKRLKSMFIPPKKIDRSASNSSAPVR